MLLEPQGEPVAYTESIIDRHHVSPWGVSSETARLTDVMMASPWHLKMVPCNAVTRDSLARGLTCCNATALRQHNALVSALRAAGVSVHVVPAKPGMPDLTFTRDATLMTPWGLVKLRPTEPHRRAEANHVEQYAKRLGVPCIGAIAEGRIEGGDICVLRPGILLIGYSGDRTDKVGAEALARLFEGRGWTVISSWFDPEHLHLDTQFTMLCDRRAVACLETLEEGLRDRVAALGIEIVPATRDEVAGLGANLLSLGARRIVVPASNRRLNRVLSELGYKLVEVDIDQFERCGGGVHCLTLPLARAENGSSSSRH